MAQTLAMPVAPALSVICNGRNNNPLSLPLSKQRQVQPPSLSIRCARVGGVETPNNKRLEYSVITPVRSWNRTHRGCQILDDLSMENKITKDLSEDEHIVVRDEVSKYMIEGDLARRFNALAIRRLMEIQCYPGIRHIQGLPCRGQHTKNNCRTLKGKRVSIAGKKKARTYVKTMTKAELKEIL